jgi:hypothetical protein
MYISERRATVFVKQAINSYSEIAWQHQLLNPKSRHFAI